MQKYTINLANIFYLIFSVTAIIYILMEGKIVIAPLVFAFFLP
jgi:hypothetical protein